MKDYTLDIEEVKEYYADLLILQYHSKYKARETVKLGAEIYMGDGLVFQLQDVLDIDEAEGKQLDIIGKILDCPRNVPSLAKDIIEYFEFHKEGGSNGFSTTEKLSKGFLKNPNIDYLNGVTYLLNDKDYRVLLKFKAIANRAQASWQFLDELFYNIFGNAISITNNKDLSITYNIANNLVSDGLLSAIALGYLEPPIGVGYNILYDDTHTLTINTTPITANVKLTASGYEQVGKSISARRGTTITYEVSEENYVTQTGTYTIGENDETLTIDLVRYPKLTINVDPGDADITLEANNLIYRPISGQPQYFKNNTMVNYTIKGIRNLYKTLTGSITIQDTDITLDLTLEQNKGYEIVVRPPEANATILLENRTTGVTVIGTSPLYIDAQKDDILYYSITPNNTDYKGKSKTFTKLSNNYISDLITLTKQ